ncbi:MAG: formyltransferase family protein [candidate division KSB1 bacterium]|nr:formyltransferase family protein [candidate division KSB1 bacterium]
MNIIVLGKAWNSGKIIDIAQAFMDEGLPITGIVAMTRPKQRHRLKSVVQQLHFEGRQAILRKLPRPLAARRSSGAGKIASDTAAAKPALGPFCKQHGIRLELVPDLNGAQAESALKSMQPDLLVLGGTPIIRANILAIPEHGTINVHMGLLPKYRGRSVAEWAILEDAPVGLTVHLVDPGVDTGAILQQQTVDISDCATIAEMRQKLRYLQHRMMAASAREFLRGHLEPQPQRKEAGKQYYEMHPALKAVVEAKLARGYQPATTDAIPPQPVPTPC